MFGPDDMDTLIQDGVSTDTIENLRLFYNDKIKDRSLDSVIT